MIIKMREEYVGVKFETIMINTKAPIDKRIKDLSKWCLLFDEKNLAPPYEGGSYGNLSFRIKQYGFPFIITASNSGLKDSKINNRFVTVNSIDFEKGIVKATGQRKPSSESMVHGIIYKLRPEINAVFHGHCKEISENAKRLRIVTTKEEKPYGTLELVKQVLNVLKEDPNISFFEMKNHGFLALGKTIKEAGEITLNWHKKV